MKGCRPITLKEDEASRTAFVSNIEMQMDAVGEIHVEDLGDSTGRSVMNGHIQTSKEHL